MDIESLLQGIKDGIDKLVQAREKQTRPGGAASGAGGTGGDKKDKKPKSKLGTFASGLGNALGIGRGAASGVASGSVTGAGSGLSKAAVGIGGRALAAGGTALGVGLGVGAAVVGIAALGAAAGAAAVGITKLAASAVESQRQYAGLSGTLATSFARSDIRTLQRNVAYAGATGESTASLNDSLQDLYDSVAPIQALIREAFNNFLKWGVEVVQYLVAIAKSLPWIGSMIEEMQRKMNEEKPDTMPLNNFFANMRAGKFNAIRDPLFSYGFDDRQRKGG